MQKENDSLMVENKRLASENHNQLMEIQRLQFVEDKNVRLTDEVTEAKQTVS